MAKQKAIEQDGTIVEALSNAMFKVELGKWTYNYCSYIGQNENALY
jgi:translation initiation factor IF-1